MPFAPLAGEVIVAIAEVYAVAKLSWCATSRRAERQLFRGRDSAEYVAPVAGLDGTSQGATARSTASMAASTRAGVQEGYAKLDALLEEL